MSGGDIVRLHCTVKFNQHRWDKLMIKIGKEKPG